jgi:tRNA1Val (adenine37-N6)-methyltransferase
LSRLFHFKHFSLDDTGAAMKVGTDAVLLGCLCQSQEPQFALDIGTGSGIIALQLAQRFPNCQVDALEIEESAMTQARANFAASPWATRLQCFYGDARKHPKLQQYDLIVCNPPYYPHTLPAKGVQRQMAREQQTLSYQELAHIFSNQLKMTGSAWCILPSSYETHWMDALLQAKLHIFSKTLINPVDNKTANRVVVGAAKEIRPLTTTNLTIRTKDGGYTQAYLQLTKDFYLFA